MSKVTFIVKMSRQEDSQQDYMGSKTAVAG